MEKKIIKWEKSPIKIDDNFESKNTNRFENLKKIFVEKLPENFEKNPKENFQKYFENIKNELNNIYENIYSKDAGLVEGYTLEEHTKMVINQFSKYYNQFKEKLPHYMNTEYFLQMLSIHDIGKVSDSVQELKKEGVDKKIWKKEEEKQTSLKIKEIFSHTGNLDPKILNIILEIVGEGSRKMDELITGKITPFKMKDYISKKSEELFISNPEDLFNMLEIYLSCDASAYTSEAVEDFRDKLGNERSDWILEEYKKGEEVQFAGLGVTKWFNQKDNNISFINNDRFGDHKMSDWIKKTRQLLENKNNS